MTVSNQFILYIQYIMLSFVQLFVLLLNAESNKFKFKFKYSFILIPSDGAILRSVIRVYYHPHHFTAANANKVVIQSTH